MQKEYHHRLHEIWNATLADPAVPPHALIMEAMQRVYDEGHSDGHKEGWDLAGDLSRED